ncbi:hypothetical protein LTR28_004981 [Elasticomyces elasticus]|nr:hypothetical protein LTR28_004981 [Elasticomyces elasticus]
MPETECHVGTIGCVTKQDAYAQVLEQAGALFEASLLWHALHALSSPSNQVNWAGFYVLDPSTPDQLLLGPFQGKVACQTISFGRGVCGAAASVGRTQLVPNLEEFPGHIACDGDSQSEIVVPILQAGKVCPPNLL